LVSDRLGIFVKTIQAISLLFLFSLTHLHLQGVEEDINKNGAGVLTPGLGLHEALSRCRANLTIQAVNNQ